MKSKVMAVLTVMVATLTACGGGGGGGSSSDSNNNGGTVSTYTAPANVVAARVNNYATPFSNSTAALGFSNPAANSCDAPTTTVYVLPNTITYAAPGVSDLSQQQAADYAEQALIADRAALGINSAVGYFNKPVEICVQNIATAFDGIGQVDGFIAKSTDNSSLDRAYLTNDFALYKALFRHELVHTYHQTFFFNNGFIPRNGIVLDTWFSEGLAEYVANGKPTQAKAAILSAVNATNPVSVALSTNPLNVYQGLNLGYAPFSASVGYLYSPTSGGGAGNDLKSIPAFFNQIVVERGLDNQASMGVLFERAFVATLRNPDGSAMTLRNPADPNNLQSTIANRLNGFLQ
jgi:hypothetical protein